MRTLTKAQLATHARLNAEQSRRCDDVYASAHPRSDVAFQDCLRMSPPPVRAAWEDARDARERFEDQMVADGRAYRAAFGMFTPY